MVHITTVIPVLKMGQQLQVSATLAYFLSLLEIIQPLLIGETAYSFTAMVLHSDISVTEIISVVAFCIGIIKSLQSSFSCICVINFNGRKGREEKERC